MKTFVNTIRIFVFSFLLAVSVIACAQENKDKTQENQKNNIHVVDTPLAMSRDSLDSRIIRDIKAEVESRNDKLTEEALRTLSQTADIIRYISDNKVEKAKETGKTLIADLEIMLAKDPGLALIPVRISYRREAFDGDRNTVKKMVNLAKKAMKEGYYQEAAGILKDLKSEIIIGTQYIPAATFPVAIKEAVLMLDEDKPEQAQDILVRVLNTVVMNELVLPLPVLEAEQMIIEAAKIDKSDHEHVEQVMNLLDHAGEQLKLAEAMGYGKRDKEFSELDKAIKELRKSVERKEDSQSKFDSLKNKIKGFQDRLFPKKQVKS